jgi:hypothetical protein
MEKKNTKNTVRLFGSLIRETEKAYQFELSYHARMDSSVVKKWKAFVPKSQVKIEKYTPDRTHNSYGELSIVVPLWLADKIGNEIRKFLGAPPLGYDVMISFEPSASELSPYN